MTYTSPKLPAVTAAKGARFDDVVEAANSFMASFLVDEIPVVFDGTTFTVQAYESAAAAFETYTVAKEAGDEPPIVHDTSLWSPAEPVTASLSIECESHDEDVLVERLDEDARALVLDYGSNVGPVKVTVVNS